MSDQTLDLRRSWQVVWRRKFVVAAFGVLGLAGGAALTVLHPAMLTSNALVELPLSIRNISTQVVIVSSDRVLGNALGTHNVNAIQELRGRVQVKSLTPDIMSVTAQGKTADQAEETADAVASSYVTVVNSAKGPGGRVQATVLQPAQSATRTPLSSRLLVSGGLGAIIGLLIGAIVVLVISRRDRRLRERDEIADSIGIPVLASIPVEHPSDAAGWTKLFEDYNPGPVDAWRLRKGLRYLGVTGVNLTDPGVGSGSSLAVLSISSDPKALALGPQLAVFAASLEIPTALVIGPQQDSNATAMLRAACAALSERSRGSRNLRITVSDHFEAPDRLPGAGLIVVVAVVDGESPQVADTMRTTATVLGVSSSAVTAEQLARVAVSAATDGRDIAGILVADPDPADHTTGRLPELARSGRRRMPTRVTGISTEIRR